MSDSGHETAVRGSEYAELSRAVRAAGLLARRPVYYRTRIGVTLGLLALGWAAFVLLGPTWWQMAVAAFLAIMFTQVGFLGHDAGHKQVFGSRRRNDVLGVICANVLIGLSYGWWVDKHNRHHAHPNHVEHDPDIGDGAVAFTDAQARGKRSRLGRTVARHQAVLLFPMLLLQGLALHMSSVRALRTRGVKARPMEIGLLAAHIVGYLALVFLVLPPWQALAFVAVHQGLFGLYMGCSFAPNHKGMAVIGPDEKLDFLRRQVLTSRNIHGGRAIDVVMGGLNYQIEHHLFPSMPSVNLRRARPIVREFCARNGVPYVEASVTGAWAQILGYLRAVGSLVPRR